MGHIATLEGARGTALGKDAIGTHVLAGYAVPMFVMLSGALLLDGRRARSYSELTRDEGTPSGPGNPGRRGGAVRA